MAVEIERYIVELGTEGRLIEMQLEETMVGVAAPKAALVPDFLGEHLGRGVARVAELLGYERKLNTLDHPVSPRGYRILGAIPRIPKLVVQAIVREFGGLDEI